jgi:hypothetical protein
VVGLRIRAFNLVPAVTLTILGSMATAMLTESIPDLSRLVASAAEAREINYAAIDTKESVKKSSGGTTGTSSSSTSIVTTDQHFEVPIIQYSLQNISVKEYVDPYGPYQIQERICAVVKQWKTVKPQSPSTFLNKLLITRGYDAEPVPAMQSEFKK